MLTDIISWLSVILTLITATTLLIHKDWRVTLFALALQYLAMMWLVTRHLPFAMGAAKLIVGWMVVAILGMTRLNLANSEEEEESFTPHGIYFQIGLMGIIALAAAGASPRIETSIPGLGLPVIASGLILIGAGVVHLAVSTNIMRVTLGLLTMLSGFEILYAAIESAILVAGLLTMVNIGLVMSGSYLLLAGSSPLESEEDIV